MPFDPSYFEPPAPPAQAQPEPEPEMGNPKWVVDTWRRLYFLMPTPGLKQRVQEAETWAKEQEGGESVNS